jgi:hypothetical protein
MVDGMSPTAPGELREESRIVLLARQEGENAEVLGSPHKETNIQRGIRITDTLALILLNN